MAERVEHRFDVRDFTAGVGEHGGLSMDG